MNQVINGEKKISAEEYQKRVDELRKKELEILRLERELKLKEELPHLHRFKFYKWSREFFECAEKEQFLCAGNQLGKSATQIRKCIEWATNKSLWPLLWESTPNQFWYFYPSYETASAEFRTKWELFLPRGDMENDPVYGWKAVYQKSTIKQINFNSGVTVYFKAYSQKIGDLQAGTVYAIFLDEEAPAEFIPELQLRTNAVDGYLMMVFTATVGQDYWRLTMEPQKGEKENHPNAWKKQVSLYDCLQYEDGSRTPWTLEKVHRTEAKCGTKNEVLKRVHGKFVTSGGLRFESFDREINTCEAIPIPDNWNIYSGVDYGAGGERGHPSAIVFIAVSPDLKQGRVFRAWRGDYIQTTANDLLEQYRMLKGSMNVVSQVYDFAARDFKTIADSAGESFLPAQKTRDSGFAIINALFKNEMLKIQRGDPELDKLCVELQSLTDAVKKNMAKDDLCDALRYAVMSIPWNWVAADEYLKRKEEDILKQIPVKTFQEEEAERRLKMRRGEYFKDNSVDPIEEEILAWNDLHEY